MQAWPNLFRETLPLNSRLLTSPTPYESKLKYGIRNIKSNNSVFTYYIRYEYNTKDARRLAP